MVELADLTEQTFDVLFLSNINRDRVWHPMRTQRRTGVPQLGLTAPRDHDSRPGIKAAPCKCQAHSGAATDNEYLGMRDFLVRHHFFLAGNDPAKTSQIDEDWGNGKERLCHRKFRYIGRLGTNDCRRGKRRRCVALDWRQPSVQTAADLLAHGRAGADV